MAQQLTVGRQVGNESSSGSNPSSIIQQRTARTAWLTMIGFDLKLNTPIAI
jgi:hypothetical protein